MDSSAFRYIADRIIRDLIITAVVIGTIAGGIGYLIGHFL